MVRSLLHAVLVLNAFGTSSSSRALRLTVGGAERLNHHVPADAPAPPSHRTVM
jgi:hypothetical protein